MSRLPRSGCMLLPALPHLVTRARRYVRRLLGTWHLDALADTAELLVSELITNAINATGNTDGQPDLDRMTPVYLCVTDLTDTLLIEVWDTGTARFRGSARQQMTTRPAAD